MPEFSLDPRLIARGLDRNRDGFVHDNIRVAAPGLLDGPVSVERLAQALAADQVRLSQGAIVPGKAPVAGNLPEIKALRAVNRLAEDAMGFFGTGNAQYPGARYQQTYRDSHGNVRTRYLFGQAIQDLRVRLDAIRSLAASYDDFQSRTIARMAETALRQNNWDHAMDNGTAQSRYAALFATVHNIAQTSVTPAQPAETQKALGDVVARARQAIGGLEGALADPATIGAEARAADKVRAIRQDVAAIPAWQKVLLVGLIRQGAMNGKIKGIERDLATLKAANPGARLDELANLAARAWEVGQQGSEASTLDEADRFAREADLIRRETDQVRRRSDDQAEAIQKLLKTLGARDRASTANVPGGK
ncbi:MAG: hypothetical protein VKP57_09585 [Candidatus Sericytochromatia bacterium]|nr:hypothetical protein [Candidatus Sericytochromatia bacterium]